MRISEQQLVVLIDILGYTLKVSNNMNGYSNDYRQELYNNIINQQSRKIIEVGETKDENEL